MLRKPLVQYLNLIRISFHRISFRGILCCASAVSRLFFFGVRSKGLSSICRRWRSQRQIKPRKHSERFAYAPLPRDSKWEYYTSVPVFQRRMAIKTLFTLTSIYRNPHVPSKSSFKNVSPRWKVFFYCISLIREFFQTLLGRHEDPLGVWRNHKIINTVAVLQRKLTGCASSYCARGEVGHAVRASRVPDSRFWLTGEPNCALSVPLSVLSLKFRVDALLLPNPVPGNTIKHDGNFCE